MSTDTETLPRAHDAERSLVRMLMHYQNEAAERIFAKVRPGMDIIGVRERIILEAFNSVYTRTGTADPLLVAKALEGKPDGDKAALALLEYAHEDERETFVFIDNRINEVLDKSQRRRLLSIAELITQGAMNCQSPDTTARLALADFEDLQSNAAVDIELPKVSSFESRAVDWAWPGYLPRGMFTLLDGDPERGKSQITCDVAARWTHPRPFPFTQHDHVREAGNVLMVAAEDNADTTIRPRLEAAGANLDRVYLWPEDADPIKFPSGIETLATAIKRYEIGLVILDPLGAYLDETINANRDADVRRALRPLVALAQETNAAVLAVRHLNKDEGKSALYRGGGSIGFTATARVVWAVGQDPNDSTKLVLGVLKSNISKKPPSITYTIEGVGTTSRIKWEGESNCTAGDIFNRKQQRGGKLEDAENLVVELLANGAIPERDVWDQCEAAGIKQWTYKQARKQLGVVSSKGSMREGWLLSLPEEDGFQGEGDETC